MLVCITVATVKSEAMDWTGSPLPSHMVILSVLWIFLTQCWKLVLRMVAVLPQQEGKLQFSQTGLLKKCKKLLTACYLLSIV